MQEIKCPHCGKIFQIDEKDYDSILRQVKNHEFEKEVKRIENEFTKDKEKALELQESKLKLETKDALTKKEEEINELKNLVKNSELEVTNKYEKEIAEKDMQILNLQNNLKQKDSEHKLELKEAVQEKENEITRLSNQIELDTNKHLIEQNNLKESYEKELKSKDEAIALYKDMKIKLSTKMVGETLEQHCSNEYELYLRPSLKHSSFEKDNDASGGTKGDYIFREFSDDGIELVSIMFEMKNENDDTDKKQKNEEFFKKLDKDRQAKNCEYAVLVSLLEKDNDYYNKGIVDISHIYDKMYVIRPQEFVTIINVLRNASLKSLESKRQLIEIQNQNIDLSHFEENMNSFKEAFGKNYRLASEKFNTAVSEIDKSIEHLQKIKANLLSSENNLRLANNKAEDLSIKTLTKGAPSVATKFEELKENINTEDLDNPSIKKNTNKKSRSKNN